MEYFKIILLTIILNLKLITSQYYPNDYDYKQQQQPSKLDDIEQKYVNSGQSVLLICDLPNSMPDGKVLFIKYDNKVLSSGSDIRVDSDDERFEIGQQYAWEWSLKINSINEDDAGVYFCKVGNVLIKQYEIIVRVPPRIKDDFNSDNTINNHRLVREGDNAQFACFATGVPKPNVTWFQLDDHSLKLIPIQTGSYLNLENLTRYSPTRYQCRASNNIPPSDTRNFSVFVEFAPEIEIQSRLDRFQSSITLNCSIKAAPLSNRYFWRKDGNYIKDSIKNEIRTIRLNDFTLIAQLIIKQFNEMDHGLYECSAENDLRVSKVVYTVKETFEQDLVPIGYSNTYRTQEEQKLASSTSKQEHKNNRKTNKHQNKESSLKENQQKRPHQRNNRNQTKFLEKIISTTQTNSYNSPYIIILEEDDATVDKLKEKNDETKLKSDVLIKNYRQQTENTSDSIYLFNFNVLILMFMLLALVNK